MKGLQFIVTFAKASNCF